MLMTKKLRKNISIFLLALSLGFIVTTTVKAMYPVPYTYPGYTFSYSPWKYDVHVEAIQFMLNTHTNDMYSFNCGLVDGYFGQATHNAVVKFQQVYGLQVDGIVGRRTWNMLMYNNPYHD